MGMCQGALSRPSRSQGSLSFIRDGTMGASPPWVAMDHELTDRTDRTSPLVARGRSLALCGGAGLAVLAGCGSGDDTDAAASPSSSSPPATTATTAGAAASESSEAIPE